MEQRDTCCSHGGGTSHFPQASFYDSSHQIPTRRKRTLSSCSLEYPLPHSLSGRAPIGLGSVLADRYRARHKQPKLPPAMWGWAMDSKQVKNRSGSDQSRFGEQKKAGVGEDCVEGGVGREEPRETSREKQPSKGPGALATWTQGGPGAMGASQHKPGAGARDETGAQGQSEVRRDRRGFHVKDKMSWSLLSS